MTTLDSFQAAVTDSRTYANAVGIGGWLKLAALVLLVSLGPSVASRIAHFAGLAGVSSDPSALMPAAMFFALVGVAVLCILYLNAVGDLVIVESLCTNQLRVRQYTRGSLRRGGELLGFRLALMVVVAVIVATPVIASGATTPEELRTVDPATGLLIGAAVVVALAVYVLVETLTTSFVVPIMQGKAMGPLAGWRRFYTHSSGKRLAIAGYVVIAWLIGGVASTLKFAISFIITAFIGGFGIIALSAVEGITVLTVAVGGVFVLLYLLFVYSSAVVIDTPVKSYLWYAALELLATGEDELDFVPR